MCGIFCIFSKNSCVDDQKKVCDKCLSLLESRGPDCTSSYELLTNDVNGYFCGSVLWTQGVKIHKQPTIDSDGNVLLWNGDIYNGINVDNESDTEQVAYNFKSDGVFDVLCKIQGPYSFIYFDKTENKLYFGRDPLGRVSLLWKYDELSLSLSSVSHSCLSMKELPPLGIFVFNIDTFEILVRPWNHQVNENYSLPEQLYLDKPLLYEMLNSLNINHLNEDNCFNFPEEFANFDRCSESFYNKLLDDGSKINAGVVNLLDLLNDAVRIRCKTAPPFCKNCKPNLTLDCHHPKIAILFSGGLDSTILALLSHNHIPLNESIDLFNVAFEKPSPNGPYNAPDRQTGLSSFEELKKLAPQRTWNFVQVDITREELDLMRAKHINNLIFPLDSIIDDSLGCALWFAASGKGTLHELPYTSPATVVLLGMGADEMFGGYRKARRAWMDKGWSGLSQELRSGLLNLPVRNLGRDNRIVSDHGRVPRFPFLDERIVSYAYSLPPWLKCYLGRDVPEGIGDKFLLRLVAWKLGLKSASLLPKRALQFGSRIANSKEAGHNISFKLRESWNLEPT